MNRLLSGCVSVSSKYGSYSQPIHHLAYSLWHALLPVLSNQPTKIPDYFSGNYLNPDN